MIFAIGTICIRGDGRTLSWVSGCECDADGAPNAYVPPDSGLVGLDALANAGSAEDGWYGLACDAHGIPYIQGDDDPFPGGLVSTTGVVDASKPEDDPRRYLDSTVVPYISVPPELLRAGARKGDLCTVSYKSARVGAIIGDVGPHGKIGEGSIALIKALGVDPFRGLPRHHLLGIDSGVLFTVLLGTASAPPWPRPMAEIASAISRTM